jgi:hypothetical protein
VFGSGFCLLLIAGAIGLEHELRSMRQARHFTEQELAAIDGPIPVQVRQAMAANQPEKAAQIQANADALKSKLREQRSAEVARLEARDRERLLRAVVAALAVLAVLVPLSMLWRRVRFTREGDELVIRDHGLIPRTRRIHISAIEAPGVEKIRSGYWKHSAVLVAWFWRIVLKHENRSLYIWVGRTPPDQMTPPPRVGEVLEAIGRVGTPVPPPAPATALLLTTALLDGPAASD